MMMGGLLFPVIAGAALVAMDHAIVTEKISDLQRAADKTAISVAHELPLIKERTSGKERTLTAVAENYAQQTLPDVKLSTTARREGDTIVDVKLTRTITTPLNLIFGGDKQLSAEAKAEVYGGQNVCIISTELNGAEPGISLKDHAEIDAGDCGIYSNLELPDSIRVKDSAHIEANFVCSAGGFDGGDGSVSTIVTTDCPQITDPLAGRPAPVVEACDPSAPRLISQGESVTLSPGTYCGGLTIQSDANVWFSPGIYAFKNGPLYIQNEAVAAGENVGLYFVDQSSHFDFRDDADISFSAPEEGAMAGVVVLAKGLCDEPEDCDSDRTFKISSAKVRSLLGTISLPQDNLKIDTTRPISEDAAFTILIVNRLFMKQSPSLVLNTNYAATTVPVPEGFAGQTSSRLVR